MVPTPAPRVGDRVRLTGLASKPELNGRHGKALRFVKDTGRWKVAVDGDAKDTSLALKPENLQVLPKYGEALARSLLLARERACLGPKAPRVRTLHILGATDFELGLQYAPLVEVTEVHVGDRVRLSGLSAKPELNGCQGVAVMWIADKSRWKVRVDGQLKDESYVLKPENLQVLPIRNNGIEGPWLQEEDRHVIRGAQVFAPEGDTVEDIEIISPTSFTMTLDGEALTATLEPDGRQLTWSDGDTWIRPAEEEEALIKVILVGPDLPDTYPEGELKQVPDWPEPGVFMSCFRGKYEDFAASSAFTSALMVCFPNPGFCAGGHGGGFWNWAPALHAVASTATPDTLCVCTGVEPYAEGEFLGDAIFDEQIFRSCGYEVVAPAARNPHGCIVPDHRHCGWHLWAFTVVGRVPEKKASKPALKEEWIWKAYYKARKFRCELPRFRFRPPAPELKPELLMPKAKEEKEESSRLMDNDEEEEREEQAEKARQEEEERRNRGGQPSDEEEKRFVAGMEWVGNTVRTAWASGGGECPVACAAAAAIAAAEEFADRSRAQKFPPGQEHIIAVGACELAARVGATIEGGGKAVAATVATVVAVFEALAYEALWGMQGSWGIDMVGQIVLGGLACAERAVQMEFGAGVASTVGQRASEAYELLSGRNEPPLNRLIEEVLKLSESVYSSADGTGSPAERKAIAQAITDNLDLSIPARGGRENSLRISLRMNDAPQCHKIDLDD